jgi:plastocyanin
VKKMLIACGVVLSAGAIALPGLAAPSAQRIAVKETNYRIALSAKPKAGTVTFVIRNASDDGHDFWLRGGGKTLRSRILGPGVGATLTAKLKKGVRYQYWCGVSDHAEEGMRGSFVAG